MSTFMKSVVAPERQVPMTDAEYKAREQLAACYRIFHHLGWTEMIFNHISYRVPGPEPLFLINPFGLHYSEVKASNLVLINMDGDAMRPSRWPVNRAGFVIHSALHGANEDAHCVMHTHTTAGMAVSMLEDGLSSHNYYGAMLHGRVAYHPFEGRAVEVTERERIVASCGDKRLMVLRNHGLLAWGPSIPEAFFSMFLMQRACEIQLAATAAGPIHAIDAAVLEDSSRHSSPDDLRDIGNEVFTAMQRLVEARDPGYRD